MLWLRILSAIVGMPLLIVIINIGGVLLTIAILAFIIIGTLEFKNMLTKKGFQPLVVPVIIGEMFFVFGASKNWQHWFTLGLGISLITIFIIMVVKFPDLRIKDVSVNLLMLVYVGWSLTHILLLRNFSRGNIILIFLFAVVWSTDSGAYFSGRFLGKNKLAPHISPNKTIEGVVGGIILSIVVAIIFNHCFQLLSLSFTFLFALIISITGQIGDLIESAFKRFCGVKDSGNIIPGHGGILDRFDSTIIAAPALFYLILFLDKMR